jgi:hypothetical protein
MASCLMRFNDQGQSNLLEHFKQALRRGMGRRSLGFARIQPCQGSAFLGQLTAHHKLQQGQDLGGQIAYLQRCVAPVSQCLQATLRLGLDAIHAMIGFREHMRQPNRGHLTQTQPFAVAVRREVLVQQAGYAHPLHLRQQQRDVIYSLRKKRQGFIHLTSVSESLNCVQIYANGEY